MESAWQKLKISYPTTRMCNSQSAVGPILTDCWPEWTTRQYLLPLSVETLAFVHEVALFSMETFSEMRLRPKQSQ